MIKIGVECGQSWWRLRSWRRGGRKGPVYWRPIPNGIAIGPIMIWRKNAKVAD